MVLSIIQREYFAVIKVRNLWSFLLYRESISQSLKCEIYGLFYYTEEIFRSY